LCTTSSGSKCFTDLAHHCTAVTLWPERSTSLPGNQNAPRRLHSRAASTDFSKERGLFSTAPVVSASFSLSGAIGRPDSCSIAISEQSGLVASLPSAIILIFDSRILTRTSAPMVFTGLHHRVSGLMPPWSLLKGRIAWEGNGVSPATFHFGATETTFSGISIDRASRKTFTELMPCRVL